MDQALIEEAALQAAVRSALPAHDQHVVVVHGAGHDDDAAQVASGLVRSLNWAGQRAILVELASPDDERDPAIAPADDVPAIRCADHEDELDELRRSDYRYLVVRSPDTAQGSRLRMLGDERTAAVLVARLGQTASAEAIAARRLIDALGLHALGLVVTCSAREAKTIAGAGFATPLRMPERSPAPSNGNVVAVPERSAAPHPSASLTRQTPVQRAGKRGPNEAAVRSGRERSGEARPTGDGEPGTDPAEGPARVTDRALATVALARPAAGPDPRPAGRGGRARLPRPPR